MKKTLRIVAVLSIFIVIGLLFSSCGSDISGKYTMDYYGMGVAMDFGGNDVEISITISKTKVVSFDAEYEIKDGKIAFDIDDDEITDPLAKHFLETIESPVTFSSGDGYININGLKYVRSAE